MANVCKVDGSRKQSQRQQEQHQSGEVKRQKVSEFQLEPQEPLVWVLGIFQVQHYPIAALLYTPIISEEVRL